jgi:2-keto-4-pentenoate hydratase/2-oxohepta-3-ene-1,7-dioic acid hydratase in catechol pathway
MKLVSFLADGRQGYGAVKGARIVDLSKAFPDAPDLRAFLGSAHSEAAKARVEKSSGDLDLEKISYLPPVPNPEKIICVGLNYRDHVAETGRTVTEKPALFVRYPSSQVGHLQPLLKPAESDDFDYEGELAVVIGRGGRRIAASAAIEHVAGYACYNDGSIRDWQRHTSQFFAGKSFYQSGAFGPWLTTADEIADIGAQTLQTRLNGAVVQHATISQLITDIPHLIAYISTVTPLVPGDVIVTGTPGGVGMKRTPPLWMKPGDIVEVEISNVGLLKNAVAAE